MTCPLTQRIQGIEGLEELVVYHLGREDYTQQKQEDKCQGKLVLAVKQAGKQVKIMEKDRPNIAI